MAHLLSRTDFALALLALAVVVQAAPSLSATSSKVSFGLACLVLLAALAGRL